MSSCSVVSRLVACAILTAVAGSAPHGQPASSAQATARPAAQAPAGRQGAPAPAAPTSTLPNAEDSVKFLVIGDSGTGDRAQNEVAARIAQAYAGFKFDFAIMLG